MADELSPRRHAIALCSLGCLGLIQCDEPRTVDYADGNSGVAWVGIHLTDGEHATAGRPWSSRNPKVLGYLGEDALAVRLHLLEKDVTRAVAADLPGLDKLAELMKP